MKRLFRTLVCVFALGAASLSSGHGAFHGAADGGGHAHDSYAQPMTAAAMPENAAHHDTSLPENGREGTGDLALEHCEMLPGHCSIVALNHTGTGDRVEYGPAMNFRTIDDRLASKFRPEIEPRPPRI